MDRCNPRDLLRRLAIALWGVCCGVFAATLATGVMVSTRGDTHDRPHASLLASEYLKPYEVVPWQEQYEQSWYVLVCVAGAVGAWGAVRFVRPSPWLAALAAVAFVPAIAEACRGVFLGKLVTGRLWTCAGILAAPVPWCLVAPTFRAVRPNVAPARTLAPQKRLWLTSVLLCLPLAALLYGLLGPHHVPTVASECNTELHVASYIVGPALYYRAPGVVPGLDFESHYGIGHAHTFSRFMGGGDLQNVLERYVVFVFAVTAVYFLSAMLVLTDWLQNPWAALGVTLMLVAAAGEGLAYTLPSCWPVRYPFLFAFLFCAVRGATSPRWCTAAGAVAGLSAYWQTDVGLYTLAAGAALYAANWLFLGGSAWRAPVFLAAGAGSFFATCTAFFGPRVLSPLFVERLFEPLLLYATGFGTELMTWRPGWSYWYNLTGPGIAVASVGVLVANRRGEVPPREVLYGAAAAFLGLAMLTKWVNRSLDILWALNGGLVVVVAGWWCWVAWRSVACRLAPAARLALGAGVLGLVGLAVWLDARASRPHSLLRFTSPLVRIVDRFATFPNPINAARKNLPSDVRPSPVDPEAVEFLRSRTGGAERVAVISRREWQYLVAAGRAPRLHWLQLFLIHSPILLERTVANLRESDRVFVERDALAELLAKHPAAYAAVGAVLAERFELTESSRYWSVYRLK